MPSVQSPLPVQGSSGLQVPAKLQRGPAVPAPAWHSASTVHLSHCSAATLQMGVAGVSAQPPAAVQSTHVCVEVSHLSFLPEQPESSTQPTQVAVAGSHWFDPEHPVSSFGSQSAQRPLRDPPEAQAPACFA